MFKRMSVFKRTRDNWHGSYRLDGYPDLLVNVRYAGNISPPNWDPLYSVSVWGNDDTAMTFEVDNESAAFAKFLEVLALNYVDYEALEQLGFTRF